MMAGGLFVGTVVLVAATCGSIGITYDEPNYISASAKAWTWAKEAAGGVTGRGRVGAPLIDAYWRQNHERPGFIKLWWGAWMSAGALLGPLVRSRLGTILLAGILVAAVYLWAAQECNRRVGLLAAVLLLAMPRFFFDLHLAALDAPVAAFCFLSAWAYWRLWRAPSLRRALLAGLMLGCAAGTKGNVLPAAVALGMWWLARERRAVWQTVVATVVVAPLWFVATWPWLWPAPLARMWEYVTFHGKFPLLGAYVLGRMQDPAPFYTPVITLLATTPLLTLGLGAVSVAQRRSRFWQFLTFNMAVHWLYFALPGQPKFNGVRLFLPAFPFLACMAAMGAEWLAKAARAGRATDAFKRWALPAIGVIAALLGVRSVGLSHPYELAFYNSAVGGARGAHRLGFESIYWGSAYLQALPYLNRTLPSRGTLFVTPVGCMSLLETYQKGGMLRPDIRIVGGPQDYRDADLVVIQCQQSEFVDLSSALYRSGRPSFRLLYEGVPLLLAHDRPAVAQVVRRPKE